MRFVRGALGAGEELVPGPEQGTLALHQQRHRVAAGDQVPQRVAGQHRVHLRRQPRRQPDVVGQAVVPERLRRREHEGAAVALGYSGGGPLEQVATLLQHQTRVDPRRHLDPRVAPPGGDRIAPGLHGVRPSAHRVQGDLRAPPVGARRPFTHRRERPPSALRIPEDDPGGHRVVPLTEHGRRHLERLPDDRLRRPSAAFDGRPDIPHGDASDGPGRLHGSVPPPCSTPGHARSWDEMEAGRPFTFPPGTAARPPADPT
ncbi:hypothetical protein APS67_003432 [Streptomyces sp. AVP053U2]|nr:hypothetical protein APS67_003432 [Streptomyces sp. AVP053U2]